MTNNKQDETLRRWDSRKQKTAQGATKLHELINRGLIFARKPDGKTVVDFRLFDNPPPAACNAPSFSQAAARTGETRA